jgi:hypothetical protein
MKDIKFLSAIAGGIIMWITVLIWLFSVMTGHWHSQYNFEFIVMIVSSIAAVIGGICAFLRKWWGVALLGSIASLFCSILGLLAVILIFVSKDEFDAGK